jgi:hypothetical protein
MHSVGSSHGACSLFGAAVGLPKGTLPATASPAVVVVAPQSSGKVHSRSVRAASLRGLKVRVQAAAGSATEQKPEIQWVRRARWINCGGGVWTAAGVSAGACSPWTARP